MKNTRRIKRMARNNKRRIPPFNLTSLMDVFTILVFFLLVNSSTSEVLEQPRQITLPDSVVEAKPRETTVIMVSNDVVTVQGEVVASIADILASNQEAIVEISDRLKTIKQSVIGVSTRAIAESGEVTILSDRTVPFKVLRKVMSSCTYAGYDKISLAVIQKASQN